MWEKTLIESNVYGRGQRSPWAISVAAFLHVFLILIAILLSYWRVEAMEAPRDSIQYVTAISVSLGPPPQYGQKRSTVVTAKPKSQTSAQRAAIVPESTNEREGAESSNSDLDSGSESALPNGVPWGIDGGDPESSNLSNLDPRIDDSEQPQSITVNMTQPVLIRRIEPEYPRPALFAHLEGVVILQAVITKTGSVEELKTLRADHPLLEKTAKDAVLQWRYRPATLQGRPVKVYFTVTVTFHMR